MVLRDTLLHALKIVIQEEEVRRAAEPDLQSVRVCLPLSLIV